MAPGKAAASSGECGGMGEGLEPSTSQAWWPHPQRSCCALLTGSSPFLFGCKLPACSASSCPQRLLHIHHLPPAQSQRPALSHLGERAAGGGEPWVCNLIQTFPSGHVNWLLHACSFVDKPGFYENMAALSRTLWDAGNRNPHLSWRVHPPRKSLILRNRKSKGGLFS